MFNNISETEKRIRYKKELKNIKEKLESGKYGKGFCRYLQGKAEMINEILSESKPIS